jgi:hypothetical protein
VPDTKRQTTKGARERSWLFHQGAGECLQHEKRLQYGHQDIKWSEIIYLPLELLGRFYKKAGSSLFLSALGWAMSQLKAAPVRGGPSVRSAAGFNDQAGCRASSKGPLTNDTKQRERTRLCLPSSENGVGKIHSLQPRRASGDGRGYRPKGIPESVLFPTGRGAGGRSKPVMRTTHFPTALGS